MYISLTTIAHTLVSSSISIVFFFAQHEIGVCVDNTNTPRAARVVLARGEGWRENRGGRAFYRQGGGGWGCPPRSVLSLVRGVGRSRRIPSVSVGRAQPSTCFARGAACLFTFSPCTFFWSVSDIYFSYLTFFSPANAFVPPPFPSPTPSPPPWKLYFVSPTTGRHTRQSALRGLNYNRLTVHSDRQSDSRGKFYVKIGSSIERVT